MTLPWPGAALSSPEAEGAGASRRAAILVVDDDPTNRMAVRACLEDLGQEIFLAESGEEALRHCLERDFAAILLDVRMAGMDGFETAALIRARPRSSATPIVFLTGDSRSEIDQMRGYSVGAVDYLLKPVDPGVLRSKVGALVELWRKSQELLVSQQRLRELESRELRRQAEEAASAERRRGEARLRSVLDRQALIFAAVPIALYTRPARAPEQVGWASDNVRRVTGFDAAAFTEVPGFWSARLHPEDRDAAIGRLAALGRGEMQEVTLTYRWRVADGTWRWLQEMARHEAAEGAEIVGTWLDVHEHRRLAEALQEANADLDRRVAARTAELQALVEELESFSYSVSHDLRAPLRSIDGFARLVAEDAGDKLSPESHQALQRISASISRMSHLIDDLLELARVSRGELVRERVDLTGLAVETVAALRENEPGREVEVEIEPGLVASADTRLVRIALENLLGNAWKFTRGRTPGRIAFGSATVDGERVYVVRDNGVGFDMTYAKQLFQPFSRLHPGKEYEGLGIGLATVRRIVQRHGGGIRAEGARDAGAAFWFTLEPSAALPEAART